METTGQRIRAAREAAGLTQQELALKANPHGRTLASQRNQRWFDLTDKDISRIELEDRRIWVPELEAICRALEVTPNQMMGYE